MNYFIKFHIVFMSRLDLSLVFLLFYTRIKQAIRIVYQMEGGIIFFRSLLISLCGSDASFYVSFCSQLYEAMAAACNPYESRWAHACR